MIKMKVSLPSDRVMYQKLLGAVRNHLNSAMHLAAAGITKRVREYAEDLVENTSTYGSLLTGELLGELGIPDVQGRLKAVVEAVGKSVHVQVIPIRVNGTKLNGGLRVQMLRSDFEDLLALPAAEYYSNQYLIPWLQWILLEGDKIIITTHEIFKDLSPSQKASSRTGKALMRPGKGWRVPPEYAGVADDNFLTRAFGDELTKIKDRITTIVSEELEARI